MMRTLPGLLICLLVVASAGCEGTLDCDVCGEEHPTARHPDGAAEGMLPRPPMDKTMNADVLLEFVKGRRGEGFVRVNGAPYPSNVSDAEINVFVSEFALPEYLETTPGMARSSGHVPRGAFVVREIVDGAGEVQKLTAVYRGPEGYNSDSGDFWFAVTDSDGTPSLDASGEKMVGPLANCSSCHAGRAEADYLFGVPNDFREPGFVHSPNEPDVPADEPDGAPQSEPDSDPDSTNDPVELVSIGGWQIINDEPELSRPQRGTLPEATVESGTIVVIGRDASQDEFEVFWDVELGPEVHYIDMGGAGSLGAPIVNGGERWSLIDADGELIDGPTAVGNVDSAYQFNSSVWVRTGMEDASPGASELRGATHTTISEWSDASDFRMEFVEVVVAAR